MTSSTTPISGLPYPSGVNPDSAVAGIQALAMALDGGAAGGGAGFKSLQGDVGLVPNNSGAAAANTAAWTAFASTTPVNAMSDTAWAVYAEPGVYFMASALAIPRTITLVGDSSGTGPGSIFSFPSGYGGMSIAPGAVETKISDIGLYCVGKTPPAPSSYAVPNADYTSNASGYFTGSGHFYLNDGTTFTWQSSGGVGGSPCGRVTSDGTQPYQGIVLGPTYIPGTFVGGETVTVKVSLRSISGNTNISIGIGDKDQLGGWSESSVTMTGTLTEYTATLTMPAPTSNAVVYLRSSIQAARTFDVDHWTMSATQAGEAIAMRAKSEINRTWISGFAGNGISVWGTGGVVNCNCWEVHGAFITDCGGDGLYVVGNDGNAGMCSRTTVSAVTGRGFYDGSFLGNTYVACHCENTGAGEYYQEGGVNSCTYIGCYGESGAGGLSHIEGLSMWIGGVQPEWDTASASYRGLLWNQGGDVRLRPWLTVRNDLHPTVHGHIQIGTQHASTNKMLEVTEDATGNLLSLEWNNTAKEWAFGTLGFLSSASTTRAGKIGGSQGYLHFLTGFTMEPYGNYISWGTGPPTSGVSQAGDIVFNQNPGAGGIPAWSCTTAGANPGTAVWKAWALIAA